MKKLYEYGKNIEKSENKSNTRNNRLDIYM